MDTNSVYSTLYILCSIISGIALEKSCNSFFHIVPEWNSLLILFNISPIVLY